MNSKLCYCYRDAANYKTFKDVIISGVLDPNDIMPYLYEGDFFVPSEVGLVDLQGDVFGQHDHIWHEILSIEPTDEPDSEFDAEILVQRFKIVSTNNWNSSSVFRRKGLL